MSAANGKESFIDTSGRAIKNPNTLERDSVKTRSDGEDKRAHRDLDTARHQFGLAE